MEHDFRFEHFVRKKGVYLFRSLCSRRFATEKIQKNRVPFTFQQDFPPGGTFVNDTQPVIAI